MAKVIDGTSSEIRGDWAHISLAAAFERLAKNAPARSVAQFEHGTLQVKFYVPRGTHGELIDPQTPHTRDELYVVARGSGMFFNGETRRKAEVGDLIFAPTGKAHRFEEFGEDFAVWVMFYGPEGGEAAS
ncbi:MAG TPA: cupin domain-containing protein [Blastocatellia bacterium]|nr:cupin domain-containing protein [Blastocatellia bacterium]